MGSISAEDRTLRDLELSRRNTWMHYVIDLKLIIGQLPCGGSCPAPLLPHGCCNSTGRSCPPSPRRTPWSGCSQTCGQTPSRSRVWSHCQWPSSPCERGRWVSVRKETVSESNLWCLTLTFSVDETVGLQLIPWVCCTGTSWSLLCTGWLWRHTSCSRPRTERLRTYSWWQLWRLQHKRRRTCWRKSIYLLSMATYIIKLQWSGSLSSSHGAMARWHHGHLTKQHFTLTHTYSQLTLW